MNDTREKMLEVATLGENWMSALTVGFVLLFSVIHIWIYAIYGWKNFKDFTINSHELVWHLGKWPVFFFIGYYIIGAVFRAVLNK